MNPAWWPGEKHELFTAWAISQGIIINGVSPARFPGRGLGMIATRKINKDEAIITVPHKTMFTPTRIPVSFRNKFPAATPTHVLYAAYFTHGSPEDLRPYALWRDTWPTRSDFEESMPILWPDTSPSLLPPSISSHWTTIPAHTQPHTHAYETPHQNLLSQQEKRLRSAYDTVVSVFPETDWERFSYHWLVVNTRSFFYLMPGEEPPEDRNDAMALVPFADYFNHSDVVCNVKFDGEKYVFWAAKEYEEGEEIYISYGHHPNDFLFTEYGFYLEENASETLYLDDVIFRDLSPALQEELEFHQYYGNYQLTADGVCYRTEIAASITYMPLKDWQNYVLGYSTRGVDERKSEAVIRGWIDAYIKESDRTITLLEQRSREADKHPDKVRMLLRRWAQIKRLCEGAADAVSC
ncbi:ribosomal N-lysine methyltransferase [Aspergillus heteromorphus CBS 117.55]|uniref:Ribosomal N-lysine methyltransferase n=1 Tax=Aspergillus heteromorphus CBS 117.55 TaxID=1448321 RepID=A0A317WDH5_9EURO|nr:ribosomal N-lysine methyltransferase [Aspergillus heteromorphus CBS 117.55]PWY82250.1 ribosomal N-lysine methyltransferase [Aspergillus heteromorphus CBS 117.55]